MSDDPVENHISQCSQPTQKWMRDHIDWIRDPSKYEKVQRAHFHALGEGHTPDTSSYFEHVEKRIGLRKEQPVVTLTKREAELAEDGTHTWGKHDLAAGRIKDASLIGKPIGTQEMGRRKVLLTREGRYNKID